MTRIEAVKQIMNKVVKDDLVIVSTGYLCRDVFSIKDRPGNFYMAGSMGSAYGIGLGLSLFTTKKVIVISGDGAALMNLGSLVLGNYHKPKNLIHYIVDNHRYASTGGQPTCSKSIDFRQFFNTFVIKVDEDDPTKPRITLSPLEIKQRFIKEVRKSL